MFRSLLAGLSWLLTWNPRMGEVVLLAFALRQAKLISSLEADSSLRAVFSNSIYKALTGEFPLRAWVGFLLVAVAMHSLGLTMDCFCTHCQVWIARLAAAGVSAICWSWVCLSYYQKGFSFDAYSTFCLLLTLSFWVAANIYFEHLGDVERREKETPPPLTRTNDGMAKDGLL